MPQSGTTRFLALGDSYTIGEGAAPSDRWPSKLVDELRRRGIAVADPDIIAQTGWTTGELKAAIDERRPAGPYDLVTLLIGVNDQYRGGDASAYRPAFAHLLQRAIRLAGDDARRVIVISIPDWGVTPFAADRDRGRINREIDAFNQVNRAEADRRGTNWVDVTAISRALGGEALVDDRLHPSAAQYEAWTECIAPIAASVLSR